MNINVAVDAKSYYANKRELVADERCVPEFDEDMRTPYDMYYGRMEGNKNDGRLTKEVRTSYRIILSPPEGGLDLN